MDRGAWWAIVHRVAKSQIRLSTHAMIAVISFCLPKDCILGDSWAQNGCQHFFINIQGYKYQQVEYSQNSLTEEVGGKKNYIVSIYVEIDGVDVHMTSQER